MEQPQKFCAYLFKVGLPYPVNCKIKPLSDSKYCLWHDTRSKEGLSHVAQLLENDVNEPNGSPTEGFSLVNASLRGLRLYSRDLSGVDFTGADLTCAEFRQSILARAKFINTTLINSDFTACPLRAANFRGANLEGTIFDEANLTEAVFDESASFIGTSFRHAILKKTVIEKRYQESLDSPELAEWFRPNPFTPKAGLVPRFFGGRGHVQKQLHGAYTQSIHGVPAHAVLLGNWAIGKTSLILWFRQVAQRLGAKVAYIPVYKFPDDSTLEDATEFFIGSLCDELQVGTTKFTDFFASLNEIGFQFGGAGVSVGRTKKFQPATAMKTVLTKVQESLGEEYSCLIILLDDIGNINPGRSFLSLLQQTLIQSTSTGAKILLVLASTVENWNEITGEKGHTPIGRYFSPFMLEPLTNHEVIQVVEKTLESTGVKFDVRLMERIQEFSQGNPFDLQLVCKHLYELQNRGLAKKEIWETAKLRAQIELQRSVTKSKPNS